jgi:succinate dehydrogenase/fumarate reductase flavoprotein subunit
MAPEYKSPAGVADYDEQCDVLVVGSGAGGLAAALTAALEGLDVILVEKAGDIGGTTAYSGGFAWIPGNSLAKAAGVKDNIELARDYLRNLIGNAFDADRIESFLRHGPEMIDYFAQRSDVQFSVAMQTVDYHTELQGSLNGGRSLSPVSIDGRELGPVAGMVKSPLRETTLMGIKIGSGPDIRHFMRATRSLGSAIYVARRFARFAWQRLRYGKDMTFVNGNALTARLLKSALAAGVRVWVNAPASALVHEGTGVAGAAVERAGRTTRVRARLGVVLASGGFSHDIERRQRRFPTHPREGQHFSMAPTTNTGDGISLAESVGGELEQEFDNPGAWIPVSRFTYRDGQTVTYAHTVERGKPGIIAVDEQGRRILNESASYHKFGEAMLAAGVGSDIHPAFFVADYRAIRRYGLGMAKPAPMPLWLYRRNGYLKSGRTIEELARNAGIDPAGLRQTIERFNTFARKGEDPDFHRGETAYNRYQGDPEHHPNASLEPLETPPFYAVRVFTGDLGTFSGLRTDAQARVLDAGGRPIPHLFAAGNDMASVFSGTYPGGGSTIGPALTFGYLVGKQLAEQCKMK